MHSIPQKKISDVKYIACFNICSVSRMCPFFALLVDKSYRQMFIGLWQPEFDGSRPIACIVTMTRPILHRFREINFFSLQWLPMTLSYQ